MRITSSSSIPVPTSKTLSILALVCSLTVAGRASATTPVPLQADRSVVLLGSHLELLEDARGHLGIEEVRLARWTPGRQPIPNLGFTASTWWVRFELHNPTSARQVQLLEVANPLLDRIDCYLVRPDGRHLRQKVIAGPPIERGQLRNLSTLFSVAVDPGQRRMVYLRCASKWSLQLPLRLWNPQAFLDREITTQLGFGLFYGLLLVMILYNLFLFVAIKNPLAQKDRSYLFYVLVMASALLFQATLSGLASSYLWPSLPHLTHRALGCATCCFACFGLLLTKAFFALDRRRRGWNRIFSGVALLAGACAIVSVLVPHLYMMVAGTALVVASCILSIGLMFEAAHGGFRPALYGFSAWVVLLIAVIVLSLNKLGFLPVTFLTDNIHQFGISASALLLSLSLADRISLLRRETALTEGQLEEAYQQLSEQDQLKSRLFSNVSHEVRTPLTLIMAPLERLLSDENDTLPESVRQQISSMAENAQQLLRLVNQLLDFSRLEASGSMVFYERTDVRTLVESLVRAFEPFARSQGIRLIPRLPEKLPAVWVDAEKLDNVLCNLVSNSLKSTEPGGSIVVRLSRQKQALILSIIDTGKALHLEPLSEISPGLHPAAESMLPAEFGLALSKDLISSFGGQLDFASEEGVGNTITVTLPLGQVHIQDRSQIVHQSSMDQPSMRAFTAAKALAAELTPQEAAPAESETENDRRPLLLIVSDSDASRKQIAEVCQKEFRIQQARVGQEAWELIAHKPPALVISDTPMAVMDGEELLHRIRSSLETSSLPVILLTEDPKVDKKLQELEHGADDYLMKPYEPRELLSRARNLVRLQQQERRLRELNAKLKQEVLKQASLLERAMLLRHYLSPETVRVIINEGQEVEVEQQRRRLTVFRLELRGFSEFIEQIEQEDMVAILNGYLMEMTNMAFSHGATVDKFIRDSVLGFFGAPTSRGQDQDAVCCAKMATEMWRRAHDICRRWSDILYGEPPLPTMVLASGVATVGNFGSTNRLEYTAMGGPVDEASALLPEVGAGELACSHSTWTLIQGTFEGRPDKKVELRRRGRSVTLHSLQRHPQG